MTKPITLVLSCRRSNNVMLTPFLIFKGSSCWLWNLKLTAAFMHFISFYNLLVFSTNFLWSGKIILSPIALLTAASFFVVSSSIFSAVICLKHLKKGYYKWHSVHGTYYPIIFLFCLQYALYFFIFELGSKDVASVVVYTLVSSAMAHIASSMSYAIGFLSSLAVVVPRKKAMSATPQV